MFLLLRMLLPKFAYSVIPVFFLHRSSISILSANAGINPAIFGYVGSDLERDFIRLYKLFNFYKNQLFQNSN